MLSKRALTGWALALAAAFVLGPVGAALAGSGPSAGDNQYTDPLANTTTATHQTAPPPVATATTPTPAPSTAPPVATTADPTTTTTTSASARKKLPFTGYDAWVAGALGVFLVAGGVAVRRRYSTG